MKSWKDLIEKKANGDKIIACTLTADGLVEEFNDDEYVPEEGKPFTAWSENYVYFPASYEGLEWVARVPRNPCNEATVHVGR